MTAYRTNATKACSLTLPAEFAKCNLPPLPLTGRGGHLPPLPSLDRSPGGRRKSFGHDTLTSAEHWLSSAARDGIRVSSASSGGSSSYGHTARSGALTAREPRKLHDCANGHQFSKEEREIRKICEQIREKSVMKFRTTREAFRYMDADHDGRISRSEMQYFFRAYDFDSKVADRFFDFLDRDGSGQIDYAEFVGYMTEHVAIEGGVAAKNMFESPSRCASEASTRTGGSNSPQELDVHAEFKELLALLQLKAGQKYTNAEQSLRLADCAQTGLITRDGMRCFFRAFNVAGKDADRLFDFLDEEGVGEVDYQCFVQIVGPYIRPDKKDFAAVMPVRSRGRSKQSSGFVDHTSRASVAVRPHENQELQAEVRALFQDIGQKLPLKFQHARDAFRPLDLERNGRITRTELRAFLRGFGQPEDRADRLFDLLDIESKGEIEYGSFMAHFDSVLGPAFRRGRREPLITVSCPRIQKEVNDVAAVIRERLTTKYKSVRDAFRAVDLDKDGTVCQKEMRVFIQSFGMSYEVADKIFRALDKDESGAIQFDEFIALFGAKEKSKDDVPQQVFRRLW